MFGAAGLARETGSWWCSAHRASIRRASAESYDPHRDAVGYAFDRSAGFASNSASCANWGRLHLALLTPLRMTVRSACCETGAWWSCCEVRPRFGFAAMSRTEILRRSWRECRAITNVEMSARRDSILVTSSADLSPGARLTGCRSNWRHHARRELIDRHSLRLRSSTKTPSSHET
jgi:hypothetical protein